MAKEILLTSERFVKNVTNISDNLAGGYLKPAIREAQEMHLKYILGQDLLKRLKSLIGDDLLRGSYDLSFSRDFAVQTGSNEHYRELAGQCQYYLAYMSVAELTYRVSYKVANLGVTKTSDENAQVVSMDEVSKMREYYQSKADACAIELQNWLIENRALFPELTSGTCDRIKSNLYSAATSGIFLGGARGKVCPPWHRGWRV